MMVALILTVSPTAGVRFGHFTTSPLIHEVA